MNYKRTMCIGLSFMGISAFWQLYDNIIPLMLKNTFLLSDTLSGAIMAIDNVIAVLLLPLLGAWSDRVDTRIGKRMPFILVGTLLSSAFMMLIPLADQSRNLGLFILSLGAVLISMASARSRRVPFSYSWTFSASRTDISLPFSTVQTPRDTVPNRLAVFFSR